MTNTDGVWAKEHPKYFGAPYLFLLTLKGSDFKFGIQLGLREYDTKTTFTTKNGMGVG